MGAGCSGGRQVRAADESAEVVTKQLSRKNTTVSNKGDRLTSVDGMKIGKLLGKGSFGSVYESIDREGRAVAIKVLDKSVLKRQSTRNPRNGSEDSGPLGTIKREIAVMKQVRHPNCVHLFEVIDDPEADRIFLVMEMLRGGEVMAPANLPTGRTFLSEAAARKVFRDLISGLEYLHGNGIVHRDIKPENLVYTEHPSADYLDEARDARISTPRKERGAAAVEANAQEDPNASKPVSRRKSADGADSEGTAETIATKARKVSIETVGKGIEAGRTMVKTAIGVSQHILQVGAEPPPPRVKLLDFGVANLNEVTEEGGKMKANDELTKSGGTPAFYSPEMCAKGKTAGYRGRPADMWACGVTLHMLTTGRLPFDADNMPELFEKIQNEEPSLADDLSPSLRALLLRLLRKSPDARPTTHALRMDEWVTNGGTEPMEEQVNVKIDLSEDDVKREEPRVGHSGRGYVG